MRDMTVDIGTLTGITLDDDGVFHGTDATSAVRLLTPPETVIAALLDLSMGLALPQPGTDTNTPGYQLALKVSFDALKVALFDYARAQADKLFVQDLWQHAAHGESGTYDAAGLKALGLGPDYQITPGRFVAEVKNEPAVLKALLGLMDHGVTGAQIWEHVQHEAPGVAVELVGVPPTA